MTKLEFKLEYKLEIELDIKLKIKALAIILMGLLAWRVEKVTHPITISRKGGLALNTHTTRPTQPKVAGVEFRGTYVP